MTKVEKKIVKRLMRALEGQSKAINELMTEFVSKKRAADWGVINDAGVEAGLALRAAQEAGL
jgi:hypothetical protein